MKKMDKGEWVAWFMIFTYFIIMTTFGWTSLLVYYVTDFVFVALVIGLTASILHCIMLAYLFKDRFNFQEVIGTPVGLLSSTGLLFIALGLLFI